MYLTRYQYSAPKTGQKAASKARCAAGMPIFVSAITSTITAKSEAPKAR